MKHWLQYVLLLPVGCHAGGYVRVQTGSTPSVTCFVAFRTAEHNNEMVQETMEACKTAIRAHSAEGK